MTKLKYKHLVNKYLKNVEKLEKCVRDLRVAVGKCTSIKKHLKELNSTLPEGEQKEYREHIAKEYHLAVEKAIALNNQANAINSIVYSVASDLQKATEYEKVNQDKFVKNSKMLDDINSEMTFLN